MWGFAINVCTGGCRWQKGMLTHARITQEEADIFEQEAGMKNRRRILWTIAGAVLAVFAGCILVWSVIQQREGVHGETQQRASAEEGDEILRRFSVVPWDRLEPARIGQDEDWQTRVVFLAEIPEEEIVMYGYNDEEFSNRGVAIDFRGDVNFFDWIYMTPRLNPPRLYWQEKEALLQTAMEVGAGSGYAVEELHVLQAYETGHLEPYSFGGDAYVPLLKERIGFRWEPKEQKLVLFDTEHPKEALAGVELGWLEPEEINGLSLGEIVHFELGEEIWLECTPGFLADGMPVPQFDGMPRLRVQVLVTFEVENGRDAVGFSLGEIRAEQD